MVSAMPVTGPPSHGLLRIGLAAVYLVLALALNPLLLQHELALPTDVQHSESDVCAWLDHVAGTSLQSLSLDLTVADHRATVHLLAQTPLRIVFFFFDPSRGPPVLL